MPSVSPFRGLDAGDEYKRYLRNKSWQCPKSPTNAHHWIGDSENRALLRCKYCGAEKRIALRKIKLPYYIIAKEIRESNKPVEEDSPAT